MDTLLEAIDISTITIGSRFRQDLGDLTALAASIKERTLLHPIIVSKEHVLIVGRRRLAACEQLGYQRIIARVIDLNDPLNAEHDENVMRKDFTPTEAVRIAEVIEDREKERLARKRAEAGGVGNNKQKTNGEEKFSSPFKEKASDIAAAAIGWSAPTYAKAKAVVHASQQDPDILGIVEEMDRTGNVSAAYRQLPNHLRTTKSPTTKTRKRKPISLASMTLRLDKYIEKIVPDVQYLDDFEFQQLIAMMTHYTHLLEAERKAPPDDTDD